MLLAPLGGANGLHNNDIASSPRLQLGGSLIADTIMRHHMAHTESGMPSSSSLVPSSLFHILFETGKPPASGLQGVAGLHPTSQRRLASHQCMHLRCDFYWPTELPSHPWRVETAKHTCILTTERFEDAMLPRVTFQGLLELQSLLPRRCETGFREREEMLTEKFKCRCADNVLPYLSQHANSQQRPRANVLVECESS